MLPLRTEILATLLKILSDLLPPRTKILATPLIYSMSHCKKSVFDLTKIGEFLKVNLFNISKMSNCIIIT